MYQGSASISIYTLDQSIIVIDVGGSYDVKSTSILSHFRSDPAYVVSQLIHARVAERADRIRERIEATFRIMVPINALIHGESIALLCHSLGLNSLAAWQIAGHLSLYIISCAWHFPFKFQNSGNDHVSAPGALICVHRAADSHRNLCSDEYTHPKNSSAFREIFHIAHSGGWLTCERRFWAQKIVQPAWNFGERAMWCDRSTLCPQKAPACCARGPIKCKFRHFHCLPVRQVE
jgi:hypothetical protein